jgi:hypothetical protein
MKIKRDTGHNAVRRLIREALRIAHENKGLSQKDSAALKKLAYQADAALARKETP